MAQSAGSLQCNGSSVMRGALEWDGDSKKAIPL